MVCVMLFLSSRRKHLHSVIDLVNLKVFFLQAILVTTMFVQAEDKCQERTSFELVRKSAEGSSVAMLTLIFMSFAVLGPDFWFSPTQALSLQMKIITDS